jgi:hypothetical protein
MESLEFTVINFEHKFAILENNTFGKINWPIKKLPDEIEIGSKIYLSASINQPENQNKESTDIKKLLEEIIN